MNKMKILLLLSIILVITSILVAAQPGNIKNLKNVTFASDHIKWTWKDPTDTNFSHVMVHINGIFETNITKGKQAYNATDLLPDTEYEIGTRTVDKGGNISLNWQNDTARTSLSEDNINDTIPPTSITGLNNITYKSTYIRWTWNDPNDTDFDKVKIYINGNFKIDIKKGIESYNATNLTPNATYRIGTHTVDISGNINRTWVNDTARTSLSENNINDTMPPASITGLNNITYKPTYIRWSWNDPSNTDFSHVMIFLNGEFKRNVTKGTEFYNATGLIPKTEYIIGTRTVDNNNNINLTWRNHTARTSVDGPKIKVITRPNNLNTTTGSSLFFNISTNQNANITWKIGNNIQKSERILTNKTSNYTFKQSDKGIYILKVIAENSNGSDDESWSINVLPKTYSSGNRVWDGSKPSEYSLSYTWNPLSFSGFYYNINNDVGNESITISLGNYQDRNINKGDIIYSTSPDEVDFDYSDFGKYQVIGFMADKYFAGYTDRSKPPKPKEEIRKLSVISQGQLHKILLDDEQKRTLTVGSTITLKEGYVIKAKDVGDRTMLISLIKDGNEVDPAALLNAGETYVYKKRVGSVSDLPIIMVKFDTVFMGQESQMAILKGMFQISENYINVKNGDKYGVMEITEASENKIVMENDNNVDLSSGSTKDLMGNLKIIVADNSSVVRFALFSEMTGTYDVRGTVYSTDHPIDEWTPMNFGLNVGKTNIGFYYDIDEDIGSERLKINEVSARSIKKEKMIYSTSPQEVSFDYSDFGDYQVIGFMADKYFAGYTDNSIIADKDKISTIGSGQLHKVLLDDEERRVVTVGGTLTLKDGYVLKAREIDVGAGTGQIWMTLLKDGKEIDDDVITSRENYIYKKKVGSVDDLPVIAVHIDSVFRGKEVNAAFIKGVFQISEIYKPVRVGDNYGVMEITRAGQDEIVMENKDTIDLSSGSIRDLMGNIKFKVADSGNLRFYPFVTVTSDMLANQLVIDAPKVANAGDKISIKVTAGGEPMGDASISVSPEIGLLDNTTDINGTLEYIIPKTLKGTYNITATKLGYEKATKSVDIQEYVEGRLSIDMPAVANQFEIMTILIIHNNTPISNVNIMYDNQSIGSTDEFGKLNYTPETSGTHTITASKSGYKSVSLDIEVRIPFSEFKALDINITPGLVYTGDDILVRSNITNIGTKNDTLPVVLIINDTEVDNKTLALAPKETKEINFTYEVKLGEGNYTVQILDKNTLVEIRKRPANIFLILGAITVVGAIIIYFLTKDNGLGKGMANKLGIDKLLMIFKKFKK